MSAPTSGQRYVIYMDNALDQLSSLDKSLRKRIKKEIESFLQCWNAADVFDKSVTEDVGYIKRDRGDTRAFGTYMEIDDIHSLIVLAVFKQKDKSKFWQEKSLYQSMAKKYQTELEDSSQNASLRSHIENLKDLDEYIVISQQ